MIEERSGSMMHLFVLQLKGRTNIAVLRRWMLVVDGEPATKKWTPQDAKAGFGNTVSVTALWFNPAIGLFAPGFLA